MTLTAVLQVIQALASLATVVLVFLAWQQIGLVRKQATTSFEDSLSEQYRGIMKSIPIDVWMGSELKTLDKERQDHCRHAIYRYIDLSNEQAFLHDKKRVTDETWMEWTDGITTNMKLPAFRQVWGEVAERSPESFSELKALVGPGTPH